MNAVEEDKNGISKGIQVSIGPTLGWNSNKAFRIEIRDHIREKISE